MSKTWLNSILPQSKPKDDDCMSKTCGVSEETKRWWQTTGYKELNKACSEYYGEGLGHVPLENLFRFPKEVEVNSDLIELMRNDGADIGIDRDKDNCAYFYINLR